LKGKAGYSEGREEKKKEKKNIKGGLRRRFFSSSAGPIGRAGMETCTILGFCSSLEQRAFPVNPDEAPQPATGVGEVK
jgi:hypothetical protein